VSVSIEAIIQRGVRVGDVHPVVVDIRKRLGAMRVVANYTVADPTRFDTGLKTLVEQFQKTRGLKVDGVVGPNTWAALGGPPVKPVAPSAQPELPSTQPADPARVPGPPASTGFSPLLLAGAALVAGGAWWFWKNKKSSGEGGMGSVLDGLFGAQGRQIGPGMRLVRRGGEDVKPGKEPRQPRYETPEEREARLEKAREAGRRRRERSREADREWEREQARAAARGGSEAPVTGDRARFQQEYELALKRGFSPLEASRMASGAGTGAPVRDSSGRLVGVGTPSMTDRNLERTKLALQEEARRIAENTVGRGADDDRTAARLVAIESQRIYERMLRTGLGPTKNITTASASAGRHDVSRGVPGMDPGWARPGGRVERAPSETFTRGVRAAIENEMGPSPLIATGLEAAARLVFLTPSEVQRYNTDKVFREQTKDRVKAMAMESGQRVELRASGMDRPGLSASLWKYDPSRRKSLGGFKDVVTDSLLIEPAKLAADGRCVEAANRLVFRRRLPRTDRETELYRTAMVEVAKRCPKEFERSVEGEEARNTDVIEMMRTIGSRFIPNPEAGIRSTRKGENIGLTITRDRDLPTGPKRKRGRQTRTLYYRTPEGRFFYFVKRADGRQKREFVDTVPPGAIIKPVDDRSYRRVGPGVTLVR
jgi:hypothetical protein